MIDRLPPIDGRTHVQLLYVPHERRPELGRPIAAAALGHVDLALGIQLVHLGLRRDVTGVAMEGRAGDPR